MSVFSAIEQKRPPGNVVVPPEAWSSTWEDRPLEEVCVGLRFVPDGELEDAHVEAQKRAERLYPKYLKNPDHRQLYEKAFADALVRWVVARGTCDPNNVMAPWEGWADAPEDMAVEVCLTDLGAQLVFDAWERMRVAADIALPAATDEELRDLPALLAHLPALESLSRAREQRARRLLRFVLDELREVVPRPEAPTRVGAPEDRVDFSEVADDAAAATTG